MAATNIAHMQRKSSHSAELRHVQDLLFVRNFLAGHGATKDELRQYDATIARARRRLRPSTPARVAA
jgi:hypothetical protein